MKPFFTTNFGDVPRLEGLYVIERLPPATISGVFLGDVAMVGETVRGPVGTAVRISSEQEFTDVFGSRDLGAGGALVNKVWLSLVNKKFGNVQVIRVASDDGYASTATKDGYLKVDASSQGVWGNSVTYQVEDATDSNVNHFDLVITDYNGHVFTYRNLDIHATGVDNLAQSVGTDNSNPVVLTKLSNGRPTTMVSALSLAGGTSPSTDDADYLAGLAVGAVAENCGVVLVCNQMSAAIKAEIATLAPTVSDRVFLMSADNAAVSAASAITEVASYRSDRIIYCFNHPNTLDPTTALKVSTNPCDWMASILSQTDIDIHPGEQDTKALTAGITDLAFPAFVRGDYINFKAAGICALEKDNGVDFVSGVTTSLTPGIEEITRRRMTDYLQLSMADFLNNFVKKKDTAERRAAIVGAIDNFLGDLQKANRVVDQFQVDGEKLNTVTQRAQGIEQIYVAVKLINHMLELVLQTVIGTSVVIQSQ
jgi:hypothetical protein